MELYTGNAVKYSVFHYCESIECQIMVKKFGDGITC